MTASALADWLERIESFSPHEIELGLERVTAVLKNLELPRPRHVFTVGGTNGKGSTVACIAALLDAGGYRYGAYTSPHLHVYNERIRIGNRLASGAEIVAAFERVEAARGDTPLTYFEFGTLAAFVVFADAGLEAVVLEVGLGGRLDAVNALDADAAIVTNVSLDHCEWLGDTVAAIAMEKAGIYRAGRPAVYGDRDVPETLRAFAERIGAKLVLAGRDYDWTQTGETWSWQGAAHRLDGLPFPGLGGSYQLQNAAGALALLEAGGLGRTLRLDAVTAALPRVSVEGRMQHLRRRCEWLFDVAHNPAGAAALAAHLDRPEGEQTLIVGILSDKDVDSVLLPLLPAADRFIAITADSPRAMPAAELARRIANLSDRPCLIASTAAEAVEAAERDVKEGDRIVVTGSFFTVGPVQRALGLYSPSS